jgi:hypothetical protein
MKTRSNAVRVHRLFSIDCFIGFLNVAFPFDLEAQSSTVEQKLLHDNGVLQRRKERKIGLDVGWCDGWFCISGSTET